MQPASVEVWHVGPVLEDVALAVGGAAGAGENVL